MDDEMLIKEVVGCISRVRDAFSAGYLEQVYRNALMIELHNNGLPAVKEMPIIVHYKGEVVGDYRADIVVDNRLILELKAVQTLSKVMEAQMVNYLVATGIDNGLLVNFGGDKLEIRRKFRTYRPKSI